jgi:hypothetical protein
MSTTGRYVFLALVLTQAAQSIEEYSTRLDEVLAPARFVSSLVSDDLAVGFVIFNASLVAFGLWCFFGPVLHGGRAATKLSRFWVALEALNGCATSGAAAASLRGGSRRR